MLMHSVKYFPFLSVFFSFNSYNIYHKIILSLLKQLFIVIFSY